MTGGPDGFWGSTPRILALAVKGAAKRAENAHRAAAWLAWTTAALGRVDKMPPLEDLTGAPKAQRQPRTWQQQLAGVEAWVAAVAA